MTSCRSARSLCPKRWLSPRVGKSKGAQERAVCLSPDKDWM